MRLLKPFPILIQTLFIFFLFQGDVKASDLSCLASLHPLESQVESIKARGGIWGEFDKHYKVRNHARVTLKLDSNITFLLVTLNHLCVTQNGVPYGEIAAIVIPKIEKNGDKLFLDEMVNLGHSLGEAEGLLEFAKYAKSIRHRKLDINQINTTIQESKVLVDRLVVIFKKLGKKSSEIILSDSKVLIADVQKLRTTDPYLKQADYENSQIPNARYLTNNSDDM